MIINTPRNGTLVTPSSLDPSRFPRLSLGHWPTPLEPLSRLSEALDGPRLYIKRDDCTGLATGGNKTRKLEFLLAAALDRQADIILTQGAVQSNHARQTAAGAARLGLDCHILLEQRISDAPTVYGESGNVFLDRLFGATLETRPGGSDMQAELEALAERLRAAGRRPYLIPGGGSNPLGALGYVEAARELLEQAERQKLRIDHIVHATGSAGTQAGLVAGLELAGADIPVHGVSVRFDRATQIDKVHALARATAQLLGDADSVRREAVRVEDGYVGSGYGLPTSGMVEAIRLLARTEGILLDPVYSGKGMAGLIGMIGAGRFRGDETVVFLHTGGAAALSAYEWAFSN